MKDANDKKNDGKHEQQGSNRLQINIRNKPCQVHRVKSSSSFSSFVIQSNGEANKGASREKDTVVIRGLKWTRKLKGGKRGTHHSDGEFAH